MASEQQILTSLTPDEAPGFFKALFEVALAGIHHHKNGACPVQGHPPVAATCVADAMERDGSMWARGTGEGAVYVGFSQAVYEWMVEDAHRWHVKLPCAWTLHNLDTGSRYVVFNVGEVTS